MEIEKRKFEMNIVKANLFIFLTHLHFISGVLIPFFTDWGEISFFQIMLLQAFFTGSIFLLEIPTGAVADRFGRKTSIIWAAFITGIAAYLYSVTPNLTLFFLAEFFWALGHSLLSGADQALVYDSLKKIGREHESKKIFGRWRGLGLAALMVSGPAGSLIADIIGLEYAFRLTAAPMFLAFLLAMTFEEPDIESEKKKTDYFQTIIEGIRFISGNRYLKIVMMDYIPISVLSFFVIWVYQVLLKRLDIPISYFGVIHALICGIQIVILNRYQFFEKIVGGNRRYMMVSTLLAGAGFMIIALSSNVWLTITGILIIAAFGLTRDTFSQSYLNKHIESHNRATVLSAVSMLRSLCMALSNVIWGYLAERHFTVTLFIIGALIILFGLVSKAREEHFLE